MLFIGIIKKNNNYDLINLFLFFLKWILLQLYHNKYYYQITNDQLLVVVTLLNFLSLVIFAVVYNQ